MPVALTFSTLCTKYALYLDKFQNNPGQNENPTILCLDWIKLFNFVELERKSINVKYMYICGPIGQKTWKKNPSLSTLWHKNLSLFPESETYVRIFSPLLFVFTIDIQFLYINLIEPHTHTQRERNKHVARRLDLMNREEEQEREEEVKRSCRKWETKKYFKEIDVK